MAVRTITKQKDLENWLPLLVSAVLAIGLLYFSQRKLVELGTAALGQQTAAVLGQDDGLRFTCSDAADSELCENAYRQVGGLSSAIWLGNSQNFAINHYKRGDKLAVAIVHEWLKPRKSWLVSYTQPNANLYEQAVVFETLALRYKPRLLILPVFLDDFREQGIRPEVVAFIGDPETRNAVRTSPEWPELVSLLAHEDVRLTENEKEETIQASLEKGFNELLDEYVPVWKDRGNLRGNLAIAIQILRNHTLGIHSYTKRPVNAAVYSDKLRVLAKILQSAQQKNIRVLLYIPPYRQDISGPYEDAQYATFKSDVSRLSSQYEASYADLDNIVPGPEWATVVDHLFGFQEPDFMHFTAEGHRRLANAIQAQLVRLGF